MNPIRVLIADDHPLFRAGVVKFLRSLPDVEVIGEAVDGPGALQQSVALRPDVLVTDITMPGLSGIEVAARVVEAVPGIRVIVLSMHVEEGYVCRALQAGASGYLLKDATPDEFAQAVRAVAAGGTYLSPTVAPAAEGAHPGRAGAGPRLRLLSSRQREVLHLIAQGLCTKEIAVRLSLSPKTVETHRAQLMKKLRIYDVAGLVRCAIRSGLVDP
ncbi:MAG TPA: response regulator transcription factor [Gemmataceae bacterium]|nr:response regulator transcription factor [Gemmataceae bacterium]